MSEFKYRVGYWWSEKKSQKLSTSELTSLFAERQCHLVKLDLDRPLEEQGPFSLIVHKFSDILVKADQGDVSAKRMLNSFESYVRKHPETVLLDPIDNSRALLDRYKQYRLIEQSGLAKEGVVITPPFIHLTSTNIDVNRGRIRRSKITFPLVCKPNLAQGSTGAHQMCIIFNEAGLKDIKPPCVAQSFVNHNAKLFKVFVIKDKYYIIERPSLKNFQAGDQETVFFYSHDISKPNSSSSLTELDEPDKLQLENLISKMSLEAAAAANNSDDVDCDDSNTITTTTTTTTTNNNNNNECSKLNHQKQSHNTTVNTNYNGKNGVYHHTYQNEIKCNATTTLDESKGKTTTYTRNNPINNLKNERKKHNDTNSNIPTSTKQPHQPYLMPTDAKLEKIVKIFSEKLGLTFYGLDIIIENGTSRYAIIDMNPFPGYDGVENFLTIFRDVVCDAIPKETDHLNQSQRLKSNRRKPTEIDSGIEST